MSKHLENEVKELRNELAETTNLFRSFLASFSGFEVKCDVPNSTQFLDNSISQKVNTNLSFMATKKGEEQLPKRKHGTGSISVVRRKNKNGTTYKFYRVSYYDNGVQKQFTASSVAEAESRLKEINGRDKQSKSISNFGQFAKMWYEEYKVPNLAPSSARRIKVDIDKHILPMWGKRRLGTLTSLELQKWFNSLPHSNSRSKLKITVKEMLNKAVALRLIRTNPMDIVTVKKFKSENRAAFEFTQQNIMLEKLPPRYKALFYFLCCTGLRIGEFLALDVNDFNFPNSTLSIAKSFDHISNIIKSTKTNETRLVPFTKRLINKTLELAEVDSLNEFLGKFNYFSTQDNFKKITKANSWIKLSTHSTRHTFASVCYFAKIQDKYTQKWLGHKHMAMTTDTYTDLMQNGSSIILDYINELKAEFTN